jgi:hypothetical protein
LNMGRVINLPAFTAIFACYGAAFTFVNVFYIIKILMVTRKS